MDVFQKAIGVDIQGAIGEQPYRLAMAGVCAVVGSLALPWTAPFYVVTAIKLAHYAAAVKEQGWFGRGPTS